MRGGVGYNLPGTNWRAEIGASYLRASGSSSGAASLNAPAVSVQLLDGSGQIGFICAGIFSCATTAALSSDITAWQVNGKLARDWQFGNTRVSPSVAVFGGNTRSSQTFGETFAQFNGAATVDSGTYRFKSQWGAVPQQLHWHYCLEPGVALPKLNHSNPKYARAAAIWRSMPLWCANLIGPHISRHLP